MKRNLLLLALPAFIGLAKLQADDSNAAPHPTSPPPGTPLATFPSPRTDNVDVFRANLEKYKGPHDMILDGDSITNFWQAAGKNVWQAHFGKITVANFAMPGDQVQHDLWRVQHGQLDGQDPKLVMLLIGTNNSNHRQDPTGVAAGIKLLVGEYEARCPNAQILLMGLFPRGELPTDPLRDWVKQVNDIISGFSSDPRVTYLDIGDKFLQPDGRLTQDVMGGFLHPTAKGYEIWANAITPVVKKYFPGQLGPGTESAASPAAP